MEESYVPTEGESKAINIMQAERAQWQMGAVFVTDEYQFIMRNIVKKARRNYLGIFTQQRDPITDRKKIFVPFTEWICETMAKNIDIDTKDIDVKARHGKDTDYLKAQFFKHILQKKLNDVGFGKILNKWLRRLIIDGTGFLKAQKDDNGKLKIVNVDRLNMIYDPTIEEIENSSGITERHILTMPEFQALGLDNTDSVSGVSSIKPLDLDASVVRNPTQVPYVEVYERYGWLPKVCLTNDFNDSDEYFLGHAIVSNLAFGKPIVHLIEEVKQDPFGIAKLKEVPNRADGRGIPEMLFQIQAYINEVVNVRLNKGRIVGLGLFELKGNITPQAFKRLFTTGGIKTDAASSINLLNTGTIDPSSYRDEEQAYLWGTRVTGTTQEDEQAASRPATNALIEQQGASKGYNLRIEDIFMDLAKFIEKKVVPIIKDELKSNKGDLVRITGDEDIFKELDEVLIENAVQKEVQKAYDKTGYEMSDQEIEAYKEETKQNLKKLGKDRFFPIIDELLDTEFDLYIPVDGENINKALIAQGLDKMFGMLINTGQIPQAKQVLKDIYNTLGLDSEALKIEDMKVTPEMMGANMQGNAPQGIGAQPMMPTPQVQ